MIITYNGGQTFKISQGSLTLAINPQSKLSADVTLFSTGKSPAFAEASSDAKALEDKSAGKASFVIDGPGEYEIKDIFIKGFLSEGPAFAQASSDAKALEDKSADKQNKKLNTIYLITFEGLNLCFLDALANPTLPAETLEAIENVDILFVPVSKETLDAATAYKLAVSLEPSIIIPMQYNKETLAQFLKEGGEEKAGLLDKFVVKKKDLEEKEGEIILLKEE